MPLAWTGGKSVNFANHIIASFSKLQFVGIINPNLSWRLYYWNYNHGQTFWDTFAFLGRFPIHTGPTPPLTPQTMLDECVQNFFRVSTLYRVGEGRTARKFRKRCTVLRGDREMTEKYEYCSNVPRTLVQDCRFTLSPIFLRVSKMEGNPVSGIREIFAFGIRNPTEIGICNPISIVKKSVIQYPKSGIHSMESTIQHCLVSDSSPVVSLYLSLVARGVWWEGGKRGRGTSFFFPIPSPPAPAARVSRRRLGTSQVLNYLTRDDLLMDGFGFILDSYRPSEID